jgi:hypothetical protein
MSETSIANLASVSHLGCNKITNLDDEQTEAIVMKASFAHCRDTVLEEGAWRFANTRDQWVPLSSTDNWAFTYAYSIPSEVIRIIRATDSPKKTSFVWEIGGDKVFCDSSTLYVQYTKRITNTNQFTNGFTNALALYLAYYNCMALTENQGMKDRLFAEYNKALDDARTNDGMQGVAEQINSTSTIDVRRGALRR